MAVGRVAVVNSLLVLRRVGRGVWSLAKCGGRLIFAVMAALRPVVGVGF